MQRLSSRMTFYYKRVFPIVMFGFLAVFVAVGLMAQSRNNGPGLAFLLVPGFIAVFMFVMLKKLVFDLIDEVWDAGDALIVRNSGQEDRIVLSDITNVSYSPYLNPPRVVLSLRTPSVFGDKIAFGAPVRFNPFATSPIIDELIARIDAARRRAR